MVVWFGPGPRRRVRDEARQALQQSKAERMVLEEAPFRRDAVLDGLGHVVAHRARLKAWESASSPPGAGRGAPRCADPDGHADAAAERARCHGAHPSSPDSCCS
jgi:hypothetical protein